MKGYLEIWRVGANILNKISPTPDKLIFQIRVGAEELTTVRYKKLKKDVLRNFVNEFEVGQTT
jgi:hypothetical protein